MGIQIEDLTVTFKNNVTAINHADLEIPKGIFGLLGENGAGKTTLMRVLTTVLSPTSGTASLDGILYSEGNFEKIRKKIGYLPQEIDLYPNLSVQECLEYMGSSQLFIQNSTFETFGLAPIEALLQDCSLLISSRAGACSVITALHEEDLITNPDDISGLQSKIQFALQNPNSTRLLEGIDKNSTSIQYRQKELFSIVKNLSRIEN